VERLLVHHYKARLLALLSMFTLGSLALPHSFVSGALNNAPGPVS
jgi:hypothetical protein